jgi:hypothetical protein
MNRRSSLKKFFNRHILQALQDWNSPEGSLSLMLPPGLDQPMIASHDLLAGLSQLHSSLQPQDKTTHWPE